MTAEFPRSQPSTSADLEWKMGENTRRVVLSGYSDDCHQVQIDGGKRVEEYEPFIARIRTANGDEITATMVYTGRSWDCVITAPMTAQITVDGFDSLIEDIRGALRVDPKITLDKLYEGLPHPRETIRSEILTLVERGEVYFTTDCTLKLKDQP